MGESGYNGGLIGGESPEGAIPVDVKGIAETDLLLPVMIFSWLCPLSVPIIV